MAFPVLVSAQQWTGNANTTDAVWRNGGVGLGTPARSGYALTMNGRIYLNDRIYYAPINFEQPENTVRRLWEVRGATDGAIMMAEEPSRDRFYVTLRMRDNTHSDAFRVVFDDYRGEAYDRMPLEVRGDRVGIVQDGGRLGVGTISPTARLHVQADTGAPTAMAMRVTDSNGNALVSVTNEGTTTVAHQMVADQMGIGTSSLGDHRLSVNGTIRAREIIVDDEGWADHVFDDEYQLASLQAIKTYIGQHGHLPGVPSAEDVRAQGIDVATMIATLLEKVEELTLHAIAADERIQQVESENICLRQRLERQHTKADQGAQ
ncbi:MAG: hypothetical protein AAF730_16115 [Bacteroidota bacterium]